MEQPSLRNLTTRDFGKPPKSQNKLLQQLGDPHINSFNFLIDEGLDLIVNNLDPVEFQLNDTTVKFVLNDLTLNSPEVPLITIGVKDRAVFPSECRQGGSTYKGHLIATITWYLNGVEQTPFIKDFGPIPIMVKSKRCHLNNLDPKELVKHREHEQEWGGYFIIKGYEKIVRMLLMTRRNYPITIKRSSWKGRGALFSDSGVLIRSVTYDQTATNNVLHFLTDGSCKLMFSHRKILYFVPLCLILKSLCDYCDYYIFQQLTQGKEDDLYYIDCVQKMLRGVHQQNLHTQEDCKAYLGKMFRIRFQQECPEWYSDVEMADFMLKNCILIHLDKPEDKFNLLVFMAQKLFAFVQNKCQVEGADGVMTQELLLGGHLYMQLLKEKVYSWMTMLRFNLQRAAKSSTSFVMSQKEVLKAAKVSGAIDKIFENFLATGNIRSVSGLGLMQDKGLTIMAENINHMRYMSHFRAVHRGSFFQEMRTTEARQLLPDAWGFICPVHTPDGAPCGLLNHLTMNCIVTNVPTKQKVDNIPLVLAKLGMLPIKNIPMLNLEMKSMYMVQLDGRIIGYIEKGIMKQVINNLRLYKIENEQVPNTLEIAVVPMEKFPMQYPGVFLFSSAARMMRPLINLAVNKIEFVGTLEQVYLDVAITPEEIYKEVTTHIELTKTGFLSSLALLIPMPDCNQSPRNMYQCQMGKQTMGTPCHTYDIQSENKLYRLQTPSTPLFRPLHHDKIMLDDFAMGTNAIVAVISYTGYDMEDAMIINKSSEERGLAHGSIYKTEFIVLDDAEFYFARDPAKTNLVKYLDTDGLPIIGRRIVTDAPLYSFYNTDQAKFIVKSFKGKEEAFVNTVKLCGSVDGSRRGRTACITYRIPRNPSVGDKFASRAGQKGICSQKWPTEDLPFTETGLVPDILFNPHGFPSRMTIAMMIEIMAGKSAAIHGLVHDASPFKFNENDTAIDYFGRLLEQGGYNYYGTETMYSGIDGREMTAQIFFGVVHYQRLRHMVSDKWQVRSTGPTDILTRQPLKGRKRGGGVRFGEMERDSLISHGASFLLQDRLFHCSDKTTALICTTCGTLIGPITLVTRKGDKPNATETRDMCQLCGSGDNVAPIQIPYIFKFFVVQLASCNINVKLQCEHV